MATVSSILSFLKTHTENIRVESVGVNYVIVDAFSMSRYFVKCCNFYVNHHLHEPGKVVGLQLDNFKFKLQLV